MSYHTAYPSWDCPAVVCHLFLYSFICAPTTAITFDCQNFVHHKSLVFFLPMLGTSPGAEFHFWKGAFNLQNCLRIQFEQVCVPPSIFSLNLPKPWTYLLECTVSYVSQKLCVFQPSSPLYSIHPSLFYKIKILCDRRDWTRRFVRRIWACFNSSMRQ